jgi:hypothetical protein
MILSLCVCVCVGVWVGGWVGVCVCVCGWVGGWVAAWGGGGGLQALPLPPGRGDSPGPAGPPNTDMARYGAHPIGKQPRTHYGCAGLGRARLSLSLSLSVSLGVDDGML